MVRIRLQISFLIFNSIADNSERMLGHTAMFLYALNHLVGYENFTIEELKGYGSPKLNGFETICHAHPEIEVPGIEVTTGPLGQGIANAVGLAIASKNLAAKYNKPGYDVVQSKIYCMTGDGCLMEGVALEAISLAGNLELDNLVLLYDNNQVTCDGPLEWINVEDTNAKVRAAGWHVLDVWEGSHDVQAIVSALDHAKHLKGKPVMINIRTIIGVGSSIENTAKAHHGTFPAQDVVASKQLAGQDPSVTHFISEESLAYFREMRNVGQRREGEWEDLIRRYEQQHPELAREFEQRRLGTDDKAWLECLKKFDSSTLTGLATREINGKVLKELWDSHAGLIGGGADLINANKFSYKDTDVFHPSVGHAGRYIRYGVREHAMASISNGIAAYNPGTFFPVTATFFMFYLYVSCRPLPCVNALWEVANKITH